MPAQLGVPRRSWAAAGTKFPFRITNKGVLILSPLLFFLQPGFPSEHIYSLVHKGLVHDYLLCKGVSSLIKCGEAKFHPV